jgi:hypothetical protein
MKKHNDWSHFWNCQNQPGIRGIKKGKPLPVLWSVLGQRISANPNLGKRVREITLQTSLRCTHDFMPLQWVQTPHSFPLYNCRLPGTCGWLQCSLFSGNPTAPPYPPCITNPQVLQWRARFLGDYRRVHKSRLGFWYLDIAAGNSEYTFNCHFWILQGDTCIGVCAKDHRTAPQR